MCDSIVCFLGTNITKDLKWELNNSSITKRSPAEDVLPAAAKKSSTCQRYNGALLHSHNLVHAHLFITICYTVATDKGRLQRVIGSAEVTLTLTLTQSAVSPGPQGQQVRRGSVVPLL